MTDKTLQISQTNAKTTLLTIVQVIQCFRSRIRSSNVMCCMWHWHKAIIVAIHWLRILETRCASIRYQRGDRIQQQQQWYRWTRRHFCVVFTTSPLVHERKLEPAKCHTESQYTATLFQLICYWLWIFEYFSGRAVGPKIEFEEKKNFLSRAQLTMMITTNKRCKTVQHQHSTWQYVICLHSCSSPWVSV